MKRLNVCRWLERDYPERLTWEVRELLGTNDEQMKPFDDLGYVDRFEESVHPNRVAEIVEILTAFSITGSEYEVLIDIFIGISDLLCYVRNKEKTNEDVDPLSRYSLKELYEIEEEGYATYLKLVDELENRGITDEAIDMLCRVSNFIEFSKAGLKNFWDHRNIKVTTTTIQHIRTMVDRSVAFLKQHGNIEYRYRLKPNSYSKKLSGGCLDFCSEDTFFDMKVKRYEELSDRDVKQMIVYGMMAERQHRDFKYACIFNPRHGICYKIELAKIPNEIITFILEN